MPEIPGVRLIDLNFDEGPGKQGSAMIMMENEKPTRLHFYVWSLEEPYLQEQVDKAVGAKVRIFNVSGGNGHYSADLELA